MRGRVIRPGGNPLRYGFPWLRLRWIVLLIVLVYMVGPERFLGRMFGPDEAGEANQPQASCPGYAHQVERDIPLDDLNLETAAAVAGDGEDGMWILTDSTVLHARTGRVDQTASLPGARLATGPDGMVAVSLGSGVVAFRSGSCTHALALPEEVKVDDVTITHDGVVLVSYSDADYARGRVAGFEPYFPEVDGVRHVLGSSGRDPEAAIQVDEPLGAIGSMAALPDGRVAFVTADDVLHLLDNGKVSTVQTTPADPSRALRLTGTTPQGRLLAVAWGYETHFQIHVVDVDTGQAEIVADLEGVDEGAVDATVVGNDLVYLAGGRLWRSAGVFE
jgi:hypothetical protein